MKQLSSKRIENVFVFVKKHFFAFAIAIFTLIINPDVYSAVTITKASGGTTISADKAANSVLPAYTMLGNLIITEGLVNDFSTGNGVTFTISCPAGWTLNSSASVSASASAGDISSASVISVTTSLITVQLTVSGNTNPDVLTISGIEVRANDGGNVPGTANLARGGSAVISGCAAGANLASLSQAAGAINKLLITLPGQNFTDAVFAATSGNSGSTSAQTAGTSFAITKIRACDQFYNVVTTYSGVKTLTYSGPSNGATSPTYTTNVSFASGVSSTVLTTTLKKAENTTISVSDGVNSGPVSSTVTVNPGVLSNFLVESSTGGNISAQITGIPFDIKITARDANNNPCSSGVNTFSGTAVITSTGTLTTGNGTTASFSSGVLASHTVNISNQGNFTITATKTAGVQAGSSSSFAVNYPPAFLTGLTPSCIAPGSGSFVLTVDGSNFTGSSVVRFNGSDRATTFVDANTLTANINSSDIASPGIYSITAFTPGTGSTAPFILDIHTSSTSNVSICQGFSYTLPDGSSENTPGTYITIIPNTAGCDSTITTNLSVDPSPARTEDITICPGGSYTLPDGSIQNTPGTYISVIPNPPGCDSIITTNLFLNQSPDLTATPVQIDCFGNTGSVDLIASNGTGPYTFGPESTTNLTAGTYNFSVTDANGCDAFASATIDPEPSQLTLTATPTQIDCFGGTGSVDLVESGGTPGYSFSGTPTTNLTSGNYNYQVTDNNGCVANASATINAAPAALSATTAVTSTPCGSSTGTATVTITGGTSPYSYSWNNILASTTRSISGLPAGMYIVTSTDAHGCVISKTATVINSNSTPLTITGGTGICPGGSVTLCATAGFASYSWSTGETTQCITANTVDTFTVTVTNLLGCTGIKSAITHNSSFPACSITGGELCPNTTLVLRAPTGYTSYLWSNGARTNYSNVRTAGTYSVTIKNADGCASTCSYTVNSPLRVTVSKIDGKCSNEFKGSATATAAAGVPPYSYLWSNGATTATISGLAAGNYTVRVTDAGGCTISFTAIVYSNKTTYDYSTLSTPFNNNVISSGSYIWFSAVANVVYTGSYPVTINFMNQNIYSSGFNLMPSNAKLIITNAVSQASTNYVGGEWVTTAPPNLSGNYFVSGYAYPVTFPVAASLNPVRWKGIWTASSSCVTNVYWKWSAATYSNFTWDNTLINIQPVDDISASPYGNSDLAGTPENYKPLCIAGALSTGPTTYTGTYSLIANRLPCATTDVCQTPRLSAYNEDGNSESNFAVNAYPNPFNSRTNIEFLKFDKSGHVKIDIYSVYGQKIKTIFDSEIDAGVQYTVEFDAAELVSGIYIYKLTSDEEEVRGQLYLRK